jgi:hypothetical protein
MKPCQRADSLLSAFIEGEASPAEARFLETHLTSCPRCRRQRAELETLLSRLRSLPRVETSSEFTDKVLARTAGMEPVGADVGAVVPLTPRYPSWAVPLAAAAAVVILVWGAIQLRPVGPEPEMAQTQTQTQILPEPRTTSPPPTVLDASEPSAPAGDPTPSGPVAGEESYQGIYYTLGADRGEWLDAYALEDYELRQPAGGGSPTLTRVSGQADSRVLVTF